MTSDITKDNHKIEQQLRREIQALQSELEEARETIRALRHGEVDALVVRGTNGDEIVALQGLEKIAESVFEQATEAIIVCDKNGQIVRASAAAHLLAGVNPLLQNFNTVFRLRVTNPTDSAAAHIGNLVSVDPECCEKTMRGVEVIFARVDGTSFNLLLSVSPWRGGLGEVLGCVLILADITTRKQAEQALINTAMEAQSLSRAKGNFIAVLAHELRNPLAPIRNAFEIIRLSIPGNPSLNKSIEIVDRQLRHMVRLIEDLLDIARIERGKLQLRKETISLTPSISQSIESCRHLINQREHELTVSLCPDEIFLEADPVRLEQIIANVVCNAAKYTPSRGHIWVEVEVTKESVLIRVRDNGNGISPEILPRIFDMFAQGESTSHNVQGGLGIGLALVSHLLRLHNGSISAKSEGLGKGSEFTIRLPRSNASLKRSDKASSSPAVVRTPRRALIIEDEQDNRESLCNLLSLWGHDVTVAPNGCSGLAIALQNQPEIVFIDLGLPDTTGISVARQLRARFGRNVFLVALTGFGQAEDVKAAMEAGFDKHVVKPADILVLKEILSK